MATSEFGGVRHRITKGLRHRGRTFKVIARHRKPSKRYTTYRTRTAPSLARMKNRAFLRIRSIMRIYLKVILRLRFKIKK